jgi:serine/threonine protein kinase
MIIHRDLKPENILIASSFDKIADWRMAAFAPPTLLHRITPVLRSSMEKNIREMLRISGAAMLFYMPCLPGGFLLITRMFAVYFLKSKVVQNAHLDHLLAKDLLSRMLIVQVDVNKQITVCSHFFLISVPSDDRLPEILSYPWFLSQAAVPYPQACANGGTILF